MNFTSSYSKLKNKKTDLELSTRRFGFYFYTFELVTRKYLSSCRVTNSIVKLLFSSFRVTNSWLENEKFHLKLLTEWVNFFSLSSYEREIDK